MAKCKIRLQNYACGYLFLKNKHSVKRNYKGYMKL